MKKFLLWAISILVIISAAGYAFYKLYLPDMVVDAFTTEQPVYVPKFVKARITKYKVPINKGAEDIIKNIHRSDVPLTQVLDAIDNIDENNLNRTLDQLNDHQIASTDQAFDLIKENV